MAHHHHHAPPQNRLLATILLNLVITAAEFVGGFLSGYLALIADAVHNLSDVAALILAWFGAKGAALPATKRSTYGGKRLEVMTAFISAVTLVVIAVFIFIEAYHRLITPQPLKNVTVFLVVAIIGLIGNGLSVWALFSERSSSLNMKTAFLHMAFDTASSVTVIVGGLIILKTGWVMLDAILSILIGIAILWSSYAVIKEAVMIFMEAVPLGIDFDQVHAAIASVPQVQDVHDLHIWSLSSREIALSCHVCVSATAYQDGPKLIASINQLLRERFDIGHGTIQLETEECDRNGVLCQPQEPHNHSHHNHEH
ncbi:MAG: cation diffusion facilitator family transporter [Candidatus Zixiibacteriota bacterium]